MDGRVPLDVQHRCVTYPEMALPVEAVDEDEDDTVGTKGWGPEPALLRTRATLESESGGLSR